MSTTPHDKTPLVGVTAYEEASKNYHYRKLYQLAKPILQQGDEKKLKKAFHFALAVGQKKQYWGESINILRAIDIAKIVANDMGLGIVPIVCALLYDLAEGVTLAEIKKVFGAQVARIIHKLIALESIPQLRAMRSTKSSEVLIAALTQDPMVILLKTAEHLYKMRMLAKLSQAKQAEIASQAKYIYVPIAHRLGLNAIKAELEDLYFKFADAKIYHAIKEQIRNRRNVKERFIQRFKRPIRELLQTKKIPAVIKTRTKSVTSILNKIQTLDLSFEQIYDVFAIRIILDVPVVNEKLSCWQAYELVTSLYKAHPNKFRNWVSYPRSNGYQALHATVMSHEGEWVEVQIRTKKMDQIAEKGYAAHWRYKKTSDVGEQLGIDTWLHQLRTALEAEEKITDDRIGAMDTSLQIGKIEVFTHTNQAIFLPTGATVLDFAFKLGTTLGLRCTGGYVNDKLVAYHHPLEHSDQVKANTAQTPQVLEEWLDTTVTCKAHKAVKAFLQKTKNKKIAIGKRLVREQLRQLHLAWNAKTVKLLLLTIDEENAKDLYYKLGDGSIALRQLGNLSKILSQARNYILPHQKLMPHMQDFNGQDRQPMTIHDRESVDYKLALCCRPGPSDQVSSYITSQRTVKIHRETCRQAHELTRHHRKDARYIKYRTQNCFSINLHITSVNCPYVIDGVRQVIFKAYPTSTQSIFVTTTQEVAYINVRLNQLHNCDQGIRKIEQHQGVININVSDTWLQETSSA